MDRARGCWARSGRSARAIRSRSTRPEASAPGAPAVVQRRLDGFLGFRDAPSALGLGGGLAGAWTGTLTAPADGNYQFDVYSNGGSMIYIDGQPVVSNRQANGNPQSGQGQVALTAGPHRVDVRYTFQGGTGYLEVFWTPPGGQRQMLGPDGSARR